MPLLICRGKSRQEIVLLMQALAVAVVCASVGMIAAWLGLGLILNNTGLITPTVTCTGLIHGLSQQSFLLVTVESHSRLRPLLFAWQYINIVNLSNSGICHQRNNFISLNLPTN